MSKLALYGVGVPKARIVQHRRRRRTKAMSRHFVLLKAEPAQRRVDGVLAHAAGSRADGRKQELALAGYGVKLAQDRHGARGERDAVWMSHFHFFGRNCPNARVQIEFYPFSGANLAGPDEGQRQQFERSRVSGAPS